MSSSDISDNRKQFDTIILLCEDPLMIPDRILERYLSSMDMVRREKAEKYRLKKDRNLCIAAYALLCEGLRIWLDMDYVPKFDWTMKPHIVEQHGLFFNLSHCNKVVACAISRNEIGIDVQDDDDDLPAALEYLSRKGLSMIRPGMEMSECRRVWTHIEAYGKYMGMGLNYDLGLMQKENDISFFEKQTDSYSLCVAGKWDAEPVVKKISFQSVDNPVSIG